jgi:tetratricopeptide (TPR) repeat protein
LAIRKKALGEQHPDTAQYLKNLGSLYINMKRKEDSEAQYTKALAIYGGLLEADPNNLTFQKRRQYILVGLEKNEKSRTGAAGAESRT